MLFHYKNIFKQSHLSTSTPNYIYQTYDVENLIMQLYWNWLKDNKSFQLENLSQSNLSVLVQKLGSEILRAL